MRRALVWLVALAGCSPPADDCRPGWRPVFERAELDRPILSLWGAGEVVYGVGGGLRAAGLPALVMRFDGDAWTTLDTGRDETLWWVWGTGDGAAVWMVGERGLALRWDGRAFEVMPRLTEATLYGVWGTGPDDVWLCGGTPGGGGGRPNDVVLHWDGRELRADGPPAAGVAFFKVWGSGPDDVWVVGEGGAIWQRTPAGWRAHASGARDSLTTVHGCGASDVWAVGGGSVLRYDGAAWARDPAAMPLSGANGVHCGRDEVLVVGNGGMRLRLERTAARWVDETLEDPYYADYHAAWIAPSGALWAAGGNYNAPATSGRYGILGFRGCPLPR
jgi:hypothetical protein